MSQIAVLRTGGWSTERTWADTCGRLQNSEVCWWKRRREWTWHSWAKSQLLLVLHVPGWTGKALALTPSLPPLSPLSPFTLIFHFVIRWRFLQIFETCIQVVPTSTNPSELCINGMSFSRRASKWANSALVVTVSSHDFKPFQSHGPLAGVEFQVLVIWELCVITTEPLKLL